MVELFASSKDSFPVEDLVRKLSGLENIEWELFYGHHGFMDLYGDHYNRELAEKAKERIEKYIDNLYR